MALSLKGLRHDKGLTAKDAADQIGVSLNTLLTAERGEREPNVPTKHKIASFYGLRVTEVWPIEERVA